MSEANLRYVAEQVSTRLPTVSDYASWLDAGFRSIILDGGSPDTAFEYGHYIVGDPFSVFVPSGRCHSTFSEQSSAIEIRTNCVPVTA